MFGELHMHPAAPQMDGYPEIFEIFVSRDSKIANGEFWHSDVSCDEVPPLGTILQLHTLPEVGGDTLFANMYAAYDAVSEPMKQMLAGLTARHESEQVYRERYSDRGVDDAGKQYPQAIHPVVRTHPETGRKALYVNRTVHDPDQRTGASRKRRGTRLPVRSLRKHRFSDQVSLGAQRCRLLGQPLRDAPGDLGLLARRAQGPARHDQGRQADMNPPPS